MENKYPDGNFLIKTTLEYIRKQLGNENNR